MLRGSIRCWCDQWPWRNAGAIGLLAFSLTTAGCAESAIMAAGVTAGFGLAQGQAEAFIRGELHAARLVTMREAFDATLAAFKELKLYLMVKRFDKHDAYLRGKAEGGPEIKVHFEAISPSATKIEVRIGLMGDQAVSRLVMARIDAALGIAHPLVPVEESPFVVPPPPPEQPPPAASDPQTAAPRPPDTPVSESQP